MKDKERLEEIRNRMIVEKHHFKYLNSEKGYWENVYTLLEQDMGYLFDTIVEQAERVQELEELVEGYKIELMIKDNAKKRANQQNKRYREAIESMKSEINYALHSKKSKDVKRHYLENAIKYADKALEGEE